MPSWDGDWLKAGCGSRLSGDAADGGAVDAKDAGNLGAAAPRREHVEYFGSLLWHKHRTPPAEATLLASRPETGAGPLPHHGAFEFSKAAEHLGVGACVDGPSDARGK
jgi:hypothetical protein